jgi:hypothetical protein
MTIPELLFIHSQANYPVLSHIESWNFVFVEGKAVLRILISSTQVLNFGKSLFSFPHKTPRRCYLVCQLLSLLSKVTDIVFPTI